ncbi:transporter substrate-binding domain-containing protein [Pseudomonas capeferrum]|uniref:substrate-binding periplasmic protein n=1 Tax=Pseudomonas capeferrum TaxID=1495066 RepID=UPI0015E48B84|nr:transporter substrate-binding domain-containing protein [Pseudomonas capeferrum]MBA1202944.1 transporter substrate-binding domain-containing protein [Pseudomonas capeferrum]
MPDFVRLLCVLALSSLSFMAHGERLRIVTEEWAPYIFQEEGVPRGIHYEVANEVFTRLGIEVQWQFLPWKRCLAMIEHGLVDGVMDIFRTDARTAYIIYPDEPMSTVEFTLFQLRAKPHTVRRLEDLAGLNVGVSSGYDYGSAFNESPLFRRENAPTQEANFGKLALGRIDLLVTDRLVGRHLRHRLGLEQKVEELSFIIRRTPQYLGLSRKPGRERLAQRFADELRLFKQEPAYTAILRRHEAPGSDIPHTVEQQGRGMP